jgi:hypothetical protein
MLRPPPAGQPAILPMASPKPGRNPANDKPLADGRPWTVLANHASVPPWRYSKVLGGEYIYNPDTDEVALKTGQRFARPQHVSVQSLLPASWAGSLPFQYGGSPPSGQPSRLSPTYNTASRYSGSPPTGYPSEPRWHYNSSLGGEFYYNPRTDEVVVKDGRRFLRPPHVPGHTLQFAAWDDPNRGKAQETRTQTTSSGGLTPSPMRIEIGALPELPPDYKIRDKRFFRVGRVFFVLWSEPAGDSSNVSSRHPNIVLNTYGGRVHSKIRRFVVIREGDGYCSGLPINTYGGRGVAKRGVKKAEHAVIYTGRTLPRIRTDEVPGRQETGMLSTPIRVDPDNMDEQLDPMSRIDFGGVTKIQHNCKVKSLGLVNSASMDALQLQFREVWDMPTSVPVENGGDPHDDRQSKDVSKIDDSEEEEDDEDDEEQSEGDFSD